VLAGSRSLVVFTNALNACVLFAYADGPLTTGELDERLGWAAQSSLRSSLRKLTEIGALTRSPDDGRTHGAALELTEAGRELLLVAAALERWLEDGPRGPMPLEDPVAQGIVRILVAGWDSTVIRALAEQPQSLTELSSRISQLNYPALKRRLARLRSTGLVVPVRTAGGAAYEVSDWLRRAAVPLTFAGRWERRHEVGGQRIARMEVEAALLLALPLLRLPAKAAGACALVVLTSEEQTEPKHEVAGVAIEANGGEIVSCGADLDGDRPTWALGTVDAWLEALVDGRANALRVSGAKPFLAKGIVKAMHNDLFRAYDGASSAQTKPTKASR
jgi:DNA-binding HxlR family transcriptional regulator